MRFAGSRDGRTPLCHGFASFASSSRGGARMVMPRPRDWVLMAVVGLVAVVIGAVRLRKRSLVMGREAAHDAAAERDRLQRRDQNRRVPAGKDDATPVGA